ncbi:hypothetical protein EDD68_1027 [Melghiribacillus thermohalophilus]|uniref:Uncharacterized protein n=1 Tax=Melghiribacillus thermohalophilus TaxID=1324956 RepID=A0A4V6P035_9BACI|nr:hypothetical protein EDD68_1027 [Melghiribacillus thermohalophilus]
MGGFFIVLEKNGMLSLIQDADRQPTGGYPKIRKDISDAFRVVGDG